MTRVKRLSCICRNPFSPVYNVNASLPTAEERAVVTTLYSESFLSPVLTLGQSLKDNSIEARMIVLYLPERISTQSRCRLQAVGWELHPVQRIPPPDSGRGVARRFLDQYTKLRIWALDKIDIKTAIYIDGDTIVQNNFDELWSLPYNFAAVPDVQMDKRGFTLSFNAGMMFLRTSSEVFDDMLSKIGTARYIREDAGQGFLNMYFATQAIRLPYIYNGNVAIKKKSLEVWGSLREDMRIIHYTIAKPFLFEKEYHRVRDRDAYNDETRRALSRKKQADGGLWYDEISLWERSWEKMNTVLDGKCL